MSIPLQFLLKMDMYEVVVHGVKVTVSVVDDAAVIDKKITELRSLMKQGPVMGLDIKNADKSDRASMLLLCARSRCLIIPNLQTLFSYYPGDSNVSGLGKLLADRTICFVGIGMNKKKYLEPSLGDMMYNAGVEVGHLAARVLQKRDLETHKLHELAAEVGIDGIKPQGKVLSLLSPADAKDSSEEEYKAGKLSKMGCEGSPKAPRKGMVFCPADSRIFSKQEIKCAIHDVYASYLIGKKLLGRVSRNE
ncbi:hypothetical protein ACFXTO_033496 [Malus domestica]